MNNYGSTTGFHSNNNKNINNNNVNSTVSRGALRSAIKFDYNLGQMNAPVTVEKHDPVATNPSANVFSCMDSTNYHRDF
jgi:hypothetical protein